MIKNKAVNNANNILTSKATFCNIPPKDSLICHNNIMVLNYVYFEGFFFWRHESYRVVKSIIYLFYINWK